MSMPCTQPKRRLPSPVGVRPALGRRGLRAHASLGAGFACLLLTLELCGQAAFRDTRRANEGAAPPPTTLTNLAQLRRLDRDEASRGFPVRVQAIVSYVENQWPTLFIQDEFSAAYVFRPPEAPRLVPGDVVLVEGQSDVGYTPVLRASSRRSNHVFGAG